MSTTVTTPGAAALGASEIRGRRRGPMPFTRLLRVQFRAWRGQRGLVWLTGISLLIGTIAAGFTVNSLENPTAALIEEKVPGGGGFALLWLAIGVLAGAAPFRSGWAAMILSVAPRRLRWLAASYVSVIGWALSTTLVFGLLSWAAATLLAGDAGVGVLSALPSVAISVLLNVTVGFVLGSAVRNVALPLMAGYVVTSLLPLLDGPSKGVSRLFDIHTATEVITGVTAAPHGIAPVIAALVVWLVVPAVIAGLRLQKSDLR